MLPIWNDCQPWALVKLPFACITWSSMSSVACSTFPPEQFIDPVAWIIAPD
ncbi:hypothetical protein [Streptomyces sp. cg36]|uniref:hypothetical protein n=1 Tax=Streptomyces sp. cg36 TaxID=3238798 RepID=UPI0034E29868